MTVKVEKTQTKVCPQCGKTFARGKESNARWAVRIYCTKDCSARGAAQNNREKVRVQPEKTCIKCGEVFYKTTKMSQSEWEVRKYCSIECRVTPVGLPTYDEKTCRYCGTAFTRNKSEVSITGWRKQEYCSNACSAKARIPMQVPASGKKAFNSYNRFQSFITGILAAGYSFRESGNRKRHRVGQQQSFYAVQWTVNTNKIGQKEKVFFVTTHQTVYKYWLS